MGLHLPVENMPALSGAQGILRGLRTGSFFSPLQFLQPFFGDAMYGNRSAERIVEIPKDKRGGDDQETDAKLDLAGHQEIADVKQVKRENCQSGEQQIENANAQRNNLRGLQQKGFAILLMDRLFDFLHLIVRPG